MNIIIAFAILATVERYCDDPVDLSSTRQSAITALRAKGGLVLSKGLSGVEQVTSVALEGRSASDEMIEYLIQFPELEELDIHTVAKGRGFLRPEEKTRVTAKGMAKLGRLPNLRSLKLILDQEFNDSDALFLSNMPELIRLSLGNLVAYRSPSPPLGISGNVVRHLKRPDRLETLSLQSDGIVDASLDGFKELKSIRAVEISSQNLIRPIKILHLKDSINLIYLSLNASYLTSDGLDSVCKLTQLQSLRISSLRVDDRGVEHLRRMTNLRSLELVHLLARMPVTDAGIRNLQGLENLRRLRLGITCLSDRGLGYLSTLTQLEELDIKWVEDRSYTATGINNLHSKCPDLKIIK